LSIGQLYRARAIANGFDEVDESVGLGSGFTRTISTLPLESGRRRLGVQLVEYVARLA